jgi:hypothetical protein
MKAVHHPKMVAHVAGKAEPIKGPPAHFPFPPRL